MESAFRRPLLPAAALSLAIACSGASSQQAKGGTVLTITASPSQVAADGVTTVAVHVDGGVAGSVYVVSNRGTFDNGSNGVTLAATPADLVLHTCDAAVNSACAGSVVVRAADTASNSAIVNLVFASSGSDGGTSGGTDGGTDGGTTDGGTGGGTSGGTGVLGQIQLSSAQYQAMGVKYSGYQELNLLTFQVLDTAGQPYPAGLQVTFSHQSLGGSFLGATASCTAAVPSICTATGVTDAKGLATVLLNSGQTAGVVSVQASAKAGTQQVSFNATNFAIVGAKASGAHITLDCTPKNVAAFSNHDCNFSHYTGSDSQVTCTATLADRFNNALGVSTLVTFQSEAGSVGPPTTTLQYDSTKPPVGQTGLGVASDFIDVTGGTLPVDVAPFGGEISLAYTNACGTLTHNPRDGIVTVIATANGEEGFVDLNGNGVYDVGEPFIDMGEPYVDENDNGQWDPGEPFVDVNMNGKYDGPNGKWDANTVIWAETRILYSGVADVATSGGGQDEFSRFFLTGVPPAPTTPPVFHVKGTTSGPLNAALDVAFMDGNFNPMSALTSYAVQPLNADEGATYNIPPRQSLSFDGTVDGLGTNFTQLYCDKALQPTKCSNVCATSPCYVVTNVGDCDLTTSPRSNCTGFTYPTIGQVTITGACKVSTAGPPYVDAILATSTVNGITSTISVSGDCQP